MQQDIGNILDSCWIFILVIAIFKSYHHIITLVFLLLLFLFCFYIILYYSYQEREKYDMHLVFNYYPSFSGS